MSDTLFRASTGVTVGWNSNMAAHELWAKDRRAAVGVRLVARAWHLTRARVRVGQLQHSAGPKCVDTTLAHSVEKRMG